MQFKDETITVESSFGPLTTRVTAEALHMLWGADVGPQDANGLVAENRSMIEQIAVMKFEAGNVEDDGVVEVSDFDLED